MQDTNLPDEKSNLQKLNLKVYSDVVCPWCYVGMRNLLSAWEMVGLEAVDIRFAPFQLDPTIPASGVDRESYMLSKFGDMSRITAAHDRLREVGRAAGISFDFEAIKTSPNTLDAHRLIHLAGTHSQATQMRMVARLFRAFFEEGLDIGNPKILIDLAVEAGITRAHAEELFEGSVYREDVLREIDAAQRMGVTGVPCFLFEARYVLSGAQPAELIAQTILEVKAAKERGELPAL